MTSTESLTPQPTVGEVFRETLPLVETIPWYGPPALFLAGPWVLFALMLVGPFAVLVTLALACVAAAAIVALIAAILAAPYFVVRAVARHLRGLHAGRASMPAPSPQLVAEVMS